MDIAKDEASETFGDLWQILNCFLLVLGIEFWRVFNVYLTGYYLGKIQVFLDDI